MAIYHFSVKTISRSAGRSAVACSAYRSGEKLIDERQGKKQDYTKKTGVEFTKIYAPENTNPELLDRNQLWNTVEKVERRKDANLAREFEIAFPHELNKEQRERMLDDLCQELVKRHGVIVDAAIHAPHTQSGSDERNYHAHIMFTGRQIDLETGDFAKKRNRDFNKENSSQTVNQWRKTFADITNQNLARAGYLTEVDHRSYANQDNGLQPSIHEGSKVTQLRRQGVYTEISLKNDLIKQQNAENQRLPEILKGLEQEILLSETTINNLRDQDLIQKKENQKNIKQTSQDYFREVFSAITEAKKLRADVHQFKKEYENDYSTSVSTDHISLNHKTYQAHQKMMSLVQRYKQHADTHNFLSFRDRTVAYLESKKKEKKDLGMMAFLTKPKELKNLNDSIERITGLFNYFSDMANNFKQHPFIKSIESEFFRKEQEIKEEKEYKKSFQEDFEQSQRRAEHRRKLLEEDEKRRFNENQLRYKKETEEYHAKKAQKQVQKPDEQLKKPIDRSNDFEM